MTVIAVVCLIVLLFVLVVPEVAGSITAIAGELPNDLGEFTDTVNQKVQNNSRLSALYSLVSNYLAEPLENWANSGILNNASVWVGYLASGIMGAFNLVYNLCVGLIICFYLLIGKERFMRQGGKILYVLLKPNRADWILHRLNGANRTFSSAILGKILDSIIIGMLCFIGVVILHTPYPALIAVIVGVTNVIPFFGPFIGAIPSTLLVLMHDPVKALYFVIFIVVLQQFDCNILDPKIVGGSIGLPAFWSLFACLLGGGLFGLVGLLLGVPTFAVLYNLCKELIDERLRFSKLPPETLDKLGIKPELDPNAPSFSIRMSLTRNRRWWKCPCRRCRKPRSFPKNRIKICVRMQYADAFLQCIHIPRTPCNNNSYCRSFCNRVRATPHSAMAGGGT